MTEPESIDPKDVGPTMGFLKVKKKPVQVEAILFDAIPNGDKPMFMGFHVFKDIDGTFIEINNPEPHGRGVLRCNLGDWIIKGVNGEIYPCAADVFEKTYEVLKK